MSLVIRRISCSGSYITRLASRQFQSASGDVQKLKKEISAGLSVIRVPAIVQKRALRRMEKMKNYISVSDVQVHKHNYTPIIKCRVSQHNHFKGQIYVEHKELPLASKHWHSHNSIGDFFTILPHGYAGHEVHDVKSQFGNFLTPPLDDRLVEALTRQGIDKTTRIQYDSIPRLLNGGHHLVCGESGCGKSLGVLVASIHKLLASLNNNSGIKKRRSTNNQDKSCCLPLCVIAAPTRELASEMYNTLRYFCSHESIDIFCSSAGSNFNTPPSHTDVLVGSIGKICNMLSNGSLDLSYVTHIVLDEVNTLIDHSFSVATSHLLQAAFSSASSRQRDSFPDLTLTSSTLASSKTLSDSCLAQYIDVDEDLERVATFRTHSVPAHIKQTFIRTSRIGKTEYLYDQLRKDLDRLKSTKKRRVMVFCNNTVSCDYVTKFLSSRNVPVLPFNSSLDPKTRYQNLQAFQDIKTNANSSLVLCCTDLASRGLNTGSADHVINYDFPLTSADYLLRVGRVGRLNSPSHSHVTSFVEGGSSADLTQQLEESVRLQTELRGVSENVREVIVRHMQRSRNTKEQDLLYKMEKSKPKSVSV